MSLIEGKLSDHYARVWDYAEELLRSNPGSTFKVCVTRNGEETPVFHIIYICFKAMKEGWNKGCRRVIGLHGSFLKGQCKWELLTAITECFNAIIVNARKRPLLTMLEEIRLYLMERSYNLKNDGEKWETEVCPAILEKMDEFAEHVKTWYVVPSGLGAYEARNGFQSYGVDLNSMYCTCRMWEISVYHVFMPKHTT